MSEDTKELDLSKIGDEALSKLTQPRGDAPKEETEQEEEVGELSPEAAEKLRTERKARLSQVLSRGMLNEKLRSIYDACVPKGRVGKFVLDREDDVIRYNNLGYTFEYAEGAVKAHGKADGFIRVGDLILMTIDQEGRELLREIKADRVQKKLGEGRREYQNQAETAAARGGPVPFDESNQVITRNA